MNDQEMDTDIQQEEKRQYCRIKKTWPRADCDGMGKGVTASVSKRNTKQRINKKDNCDGVAPARPFPSERGPETAKSRGMTNVAATMWSLACPSGRYTSTKTRAYSSRETRSSPARSRDRMRCQTICDAASLSPAVRPPLSGMKAFM